ncbi:MAG: hypothetical protein V3T83_20385, partial [Acidobacteriota bacterium]
EFRADAECRDCHVEIGEEWRRSGHADADRFRRLSEELGPQAVAHLEAYYRPAAILARDDPSRPPAARSVFQQRGVDCISCHMDAQFRMHGMQGYDSPHKTVVDESLDTVEACIPCHGQGDELDQVTAWKENGFEEAMLSCHSCHMLDTYRRLVQHWSMPNLPQRSSHSHGFRGPFDAVFVESAILLEVRQSAGQIQVDLTAQGIGHQFPGLGFRQVVVRTQGRDAAGLVLWQRDEIIEESRGNRLQPNETRTFSYLAGEAVDVESALLYKWTSQTPESEAVVLQCARLGDSL